MTRILAVCSLIAVALGAAVWQHHSADPAHACSLAPFNVSSLGEAQGVEAAAIGTLGEQHGAAIELIVEEYYKAPPSKAEVLMVRNLLQSTTPSCEPIPLRVMALEPGTRVIAMLERDTDGLGANWRPQLVRGLVPIRDEKIESFVRPGPPWTPVEVPLDVAREQLAKLGQRSLAEPGRRESIPQATQPLGCLYGPPTVPYLARTAPIIALGKVETANAAVAEVRVSRGFFGAEDGELIKLDNRHYEYTMDLGDCEERAGKGPRFEVGQELLMFARSQVPNDIAGYRGASIDSGGIFFATMPEPDRWSLPDGTRGGMSLGEAIKVIETAVASRPALATENETAPDPTPAPVSSSATELGDDDGPGWWWLLLAATVAGAGAGGMVAQVVRR